jgi:endonuclease/exonuclease/phosphatase (EEP) superfamily protein YafD
VSRPSDTGAEHGPSRQGSRAVWTWIGRRLRSYARLGVALLVIALVVGACAPLWPAFDLANHFQAQYFLAGLLAMLVLLAMRSWRWSAVALICVLVTGARVVSWWIPVEPAADVHAASTDRPALRVMLSNVLRQNPQHDQVIEMIEREQPDVIVLQETNDRWMEALSPIHRTHPVVIASPRSDHFGLAVLSRIAPVRSQLVHLGEAGVPSLECVLEVDGRIVTILVTHPVPPVSIHRTWLRDEQLARVADRLARTDGLKLLVGDLNATMWSRPYRQLVARTKLHDARRGFGLLPSWPMTLPAVARIPIDHVLVSKPIAVTDCRLGAPIGSDHRPVIVDLALPVEAPAAVD